MSCWNIENSEAEDKCRHSICEAWVLQKWIPNFDRRKTNKFTILQQFSAENRNTFNAYGASVIAAVEKAYFAFYRVTKCIPHQKIELLDLALNKTYSINDVNASSQLKEGAILYIQLIEVDCETIICENAPYVFGGNAELDVIHCIDYIKEHHGKKRMTPKVLREFEEYFRVICLKHIDAMFRPKEFCNTDGDPIQLSTLTYALKIPLLEALDKLMPLSYNAFKEEILDRAKKNKAGEIVELEFDWAQKGNKVHKDWTNTVLGSFTLKPGEISIFVNLRKRLSRIKTCITKLLGDTAELVNTEAVDMETYQERLQSNEDMSVDPAVASDSLSNEAMQEIAKEALAKHYVNWAYENIPMLEGQTPMEAIKTKSGRLKVEALLREFENMPEIVDGIPNKHFINLTRKELGLALKK
jgi:hypothetical protein